MRRIGVSVLLIALSVIALSVGVAHAAPLSGREFSSLKKRAQRALKTGDMTTLAATVANIGDDDSKRALDFLLSMAKIPDGNVYNAARDAIAKMDSQEAKALVLKKLRKGGGNTFGKMLLVDAMGTRGDSFAGEALGVTCSNARRPGVQRAAIAGIKRKKLKSGVSGLIDLLARLEKGDEDSLNLSLVRDTLQEITGESFKTAADWSNFWEVRKDSFQRPTTGGVKKHAGTARRKRPTFFGSEIKSSRLVFVIDTSGSMEAADGMGGGGLHTGPGGLPGAGANSRVRIERAKAQLMGVIKQLPAKTRFTIVAYSGVLMMGPGGPVAPPGTKPNGLLPPKIGNIEWLRTWKPKLMPANGKNKKDATKFVKALKADGGTFTLNALKAAFEIAGADTIVVLSDGMPNEYDFQKNKQLTPDDILADVAAMNRVKRCVIDTFGFDAAGGEPRRTPGGMRGGHRRGTGGGAPAGFPGVGGGAGGGLGKFMQDLADQNGGDYTQIK